MKVICAGLAGIVLLIGAANTYSYEWGRAISSYRAVMVFLLGIGIIYAIGEKR